MATLIRDLEQPNRNPDSSAPSRHFVDEYGRIRHLYCPMRWVRDADNPGAHLRLFRDLSCRRGLMRIMNAHRLTIFKDLKIEVAGFETAERGEHEYDVCSSFPQSVSVAESEFFDAGSS